MADLFTYLARQVLGSQPEVGPLLPPRFAAWPDLPLASPLAQAPEPVDEPETAEAALFPPPLIAPEHPAVDTPLPSLRQLSQVGTGPGSSTQPDLPSMPEDAPETADAEPGDIQPDAAPPVVPAADGSRPGVAGGAPGPPPSPASENTLQPGSPVKLLPAAQPAEDRGDGAAPQAAVGGQTTAAPEDPLSEVDFSPGHGRPTLQRGADTAKGEQSPSISPLERASSYEPDDSSPGEAGPTENPPLSAEGRPAAAGDPAAAVQESRTADVALRPLAHEPAPAPPAPPGPAPVLQRQAGPAAKAAVPPRPASTTPQTQPVAGQGQTTAPPASVGDPATAAPEDLLSEVDSLPGHERPTLQHRADTAKGEQSPSISPLERALSYEPDDSSPGQAGPTENPPLSAPGRPAAAGDPAAADQESRRADAALRPLVQSAPPGPEPVIQRPMSPGADLPPTAVTLSAAPPSATEELSPPPLITSAPGAQPQATSSTGESLTGAEAAIRPLDQPLMPLAGQPGPAAGQGIIAPVEAASVDQRPPSRIGHEAPDDGRGLPGPAEPSIVPAPEALPAGGRSASRARERVFSRREPAPGWTGMREPRPAVRVTIGRVEVRMAPPEPPPPVQPRQPLRLALSLDEYLKGGEP